MTYHQSVLVKNEPSILNKNMFKYVAIATMLVGSRCKFQGPNKHFCFLPILPKLLIINY